MPGSYSPLAAEPKSSSLATRCFLHSASMTSRCCGVNGNISGLYLATACSRSLIPVNPHVFRRSTDRDDVRLAVAIQIRDGEVFDSNASRIELGLRPVRRIVHA